MALVRTLPTEVNPEQRDALAAPRQVARFLCGLPSPSASRAKLARHRLFGAMARVPFEKVLVLAEWVR